MATILVNITYILKISFESKFWARNDRQWSRMIKRYELPYFSVKQAVAINNIYGNFLFYSINGICNINKNVIYNFFMLPAMEHL